MNAKPYTLEPHGDGWLLVGPACPREDGYYRIGLAAAQAEAKLLSEAHEAAQCERAAEVRGLREALSRLISAAEVYAADQAKAEDPRCGLVQPVSVEEAEELNAALLAAEAALAGEKGGGA